jgi:cytochrome c oxidase subunit 1
MPRRIPDYALQFAEFNAISTVGAFIFGFSQLMFVYIIFKAIKGGQKATDQVWEGAEGLEWTLSSPPPYHSFETAPIVK